MLILYATNARSNYIVSCYDQLLLFYLLFAIITFTLFIGISLYRLLYGLGGEVLRFYLTLLPVVITSLSIMFAVSFWVVNRVEGIAEDIGDDRLVRTTQNIKMIIVYAYAFSVFFIFGPLLMLPNPISTSALVSINLSLSYPLGMIAGIIQALIVLDIVAVTLRRRLRRQR
jgi:cellulose synthase/poly-beta-1,6-N-acetylglucosamine synthase-like glycosyltransferase